MANTQKIQEIKSKIEKLKKGLTAKTSATLKQKAKTQIKKYEDEIKSLKTPSKKSGLKGSVAKAMALSAKIRKVQGLSSSKSDVEKDAGRPALRAGKRVSKEGNTYYEYRENRIDRRPQKYARLADGGMMAKGGVTYGSFGSGRLNKNAWISANYIGDSKVSLGDLQSYLERNTNEKFDKDKIYTITRTLYKSGKFVIDDNKDWRESKIYRKRKMEDGGTTDIGGTEYNSEDLSGMFSHGGETHRAESMFAQGGMTEHGLKRYDEIIDDMFWDNSVVVVNKKDGTRAVVNLSTGQRKEAKM